MEEHNKEQQADKQVETSAGLSELQTCQTQLQEWKDRALRTSAEFENYKKREQRERANWERIAQQEVIRPLLAVIDNFDRAQAQLHHLPQEAKSAVEGIILIAKEFEKYLQNVGIEIIGQAEAFDPEIHEAVMQVNDSQKPSGSIVAVLEKGYRFKGYVLRPAKVSVAA